MKKKIIIGLSILLAILLLVPIPMRLKDGGTIVYNAVLYRVDKVHSINPTSDSADDFLLEGTIITILGIEVYNDVE